jgi:hypothetical protein
MPKFICKNCGYTGRDKWVMEKHLNRKYPCSSVIIVEKENLTVKKLDHNGEADVLPNNKINEKEMIFDLKKQSIINK